jgi:hypothetical protein
LQAVKAARSRLQSNLLDGSAELKRKLAFVLVLIAAGPDVIVVSGGAASVIQM